MLIRTQTYPKIATIIIPTTTTTTIIIIIATKEKKKCKTTHSKLNNLTKILMRFYKKLPVQKSKKKQRII
jgi:hypothetical protein